MDLMKQLTQLESLDGITEQQRGNQFEKWLNKLLSQAKLRPKTRYRPKGEEIDGSFVFDGRVFLLEAKWTKDAIPASTLYEFKGKVDGKLTGTIGVFISMSNYSENAVDALRFGKALNIILFSHEDVHFCLEAGFRAVLDVKLRAAAEIGEVFVPFQPPAVIHRRDELTIVVEGPRDERIIHYVAQLLAEKHGAIRDYGTAPAMGVIGLPKVAAALNGEGNQEVLIIADGDSDPSARIAWLKRQIEGDDISVMVLEPGLEKWLPGAQETDWRTRPEEFRRLLQMIDIHALESSDPDFRRFAAYLGIQL